METLLKDKNMKAVKYDVDNNQNDYDYIKEIFENKKRTALSDERYLKFFGREGFIVMIEKESPILCSAFLAKSDNEELNNKFSFLCTENNESVQDEDVLYFFYKLLKKFNQENEFKQIVEKYGPVENIDSLLSSFKKNNKLKYEY